MNLHPALAEAMVKQRERELQRLRRAAAGRRASEAEGANGARPELGEQIVIRRARPEDAASLSRLGQLEGDSARGERFARLAGASAGEVLVAEVAGALVAALEQRTGRGLADPFRRSAAAMELLRVRAEQLRVPGSTGRLAGLRGHLRARQARRPRVAA